MKLSKRRIVESALATVRNIAPSLADLGVRIGMVHPDLALTIAMGAGLLTYWHDVARDRGIELFEFIEQHKTEFTESIVKSQEFKATLLNVWEKHIRENSEAKRERLRRFLLALGRGKEIHSDLHTKIYAVIEQMTDMEAELFGVIIRSSNREQFRKMQLNLTGGEFDKYPESVIQDVCHSLHSYRLLNSTEATLGGVMLIKQITTFGEMYYDFILND